MLTQLGYQSENGVWRNFYLTGAQELRNGVVDLGGGLTVNDDTLAAMPVAMLLDYLAVRLDGLAAQGVELRIDLHLSDPDEHLVVELARSVLHHHVGPRAGTPDLALHMGATAFKHLVVGRRTLDELAAHDEVQVEGDRATLERLVGLLDDFRMWFHIVEP